MSTTEVYIQKITEKCQTKKCPAIKYHAVNISPTGLLSPHESSPISSALESEICLFSLLNIDEFAFRLVIKAKHYNNKHKRIGNVELDSRRFILQPRDRRRSAKAGCFDKTTRSNPMTPKKKTSKKTRERRKASNY
jgi:hypothetical protein